LSAGGAWPEDEGNLRRNAILLGYALLVIDVNFGKGYGVFLRVFGGELLEYGADLFAWSAPVGINWKEQSLVDG
jgi:hypothetical protein